MKNLKVARRKIFYIRMKKTSILAERLLLETFCIGDILERMLSTKTDIREQPPTAVTCLQHPSATSMTLQHVVSHQ